MFSSSCLHIFVDNFLMVLVGWESQLLETGFLAILFCPLVTMQKYPKHTPPSFVAIYGNRWLIFRIMIGAVCQYFTCELDQF